MYLFIIGTGRCGSTLVHEVIGRHPEVGFVTNLEDRLPGRMPFGPWSSSLYRSLPPSLSEKGGLRYAPSEGYRILAREVSPMLCDPMRDLTERDATPWIADRVEAFFSRRKAAQRRPTFLHKFTGWPRARLLHAVLPAARFVHVVRDGRAVANSWLQMPWWQGYRGPRGWNFGLLPPAYEREWEASGRSFVILAGLAWKMLLDAHDDARSALPEESWLELRYEDVLDDPRGQLHRILAFAGLSWTRRFEDGFNRYTFRRDRDAAFRRDLGEASLASLEVSLSEHLAARGYA